MKKIIILCVLAPIISFSQSIIESTENDDLVAVMRGIQKGININFQDEGGFTALHIASWNGYLDILRYLLDSGADPNIASKAGSTPLRFATPEAKTLLIQYGAYESETQTPIPRLLYSPKIYVENTKPITNTVVSNIISNIITNISNFIENTIYISNTYRVYDYPKLSYNLLSNLTPEQSITLHDWDPSGNNSIHQAARAGDLDKIKQLVKFGINPKTKNIIGDTALRFATENNHMEVVKYLIEVIGLDVNNANQEGTTALIVATFNNNPDMIQYLTHMGANVNQTASASVIRTVGDVEQELVITGWTALMAAAQLGYDDSVKMLLDSGANINATDSDNWNALLFAVQNGYVETAQLLIERGINYNIESVDNHTALSLATLNNDDEMINLLSNIGAIDSSIPIISYEESYTETTVEVEGYEYEEYEDDEENDYEEENNNGEE
ncbi:MAG: ankyrin repeat domain-containing protein [Brevinema sp.]